MAMRDDALPQAASLLKGVSMPRAECDAAVLQWLHTGDAQTAATQLEALRAANPTDLLIALSLASIYTRGLNRHDDAIKILESSWRDFQSWGRADARLVLSDAYVGSGKVDLAFKELQRVANTLRGAHALGRLLDVHAVPGVRNRAEQAELHFKEAVALCPTLKEVHHDFGVFLLANGRYEEAAREFSAALAADAHYAHALFGLAEATTLQHVTSAGRYTPVEMAKCRGMYEACAARWPEAARRGMLVVAPQLAELRQQLCRYRILNLHTMLGKGMLSEVLEVTTKGHAYALKCVSKEKLAEHCGTVLDEHNAQHIEHECFARASRPTSSVPRHV